MMEEVLRLLTQINEDNAVPKNVKHKVNSIINELNLEEEMAIKIDRSLQKLGDLAEDPNLPSYIRTLVWNVVSLLESNKS